MSVQIEKKRSQSLSDHLILEENQEGGIVVQNISDASVADASGLKTGDEIVGATIYFDNLKKEDVLKIMKLTEPYNAEMKVHTKNELKSPSGAWATPDFSIRTPEAMLMNSDYNKLFNNKIKRHLKTAISCDDIFSASNADVKAPGMQVDRLNEGMHAKYNTINISGPSVSSPDVSLKGTKLEHPNFDGDWSSANMKTPDVNVSTPKMKGKIEVPDVDVNTPNARVKRPMFKLPSWGGSKLKGPVLDVDANIKTPDVNVTTPKVKGGITAPDLDVNLPKAEVKGSKFTMSTWGKSGPKVKGPDLSGPNLDIDLPDVNINGPNVKMPSLNVSKSKYNSPDIGLNMKGTKVKGDLKGPNIDLNAPDFDISGPKLHGPEIDIDSKFPRGNIDDPNVNIKTPEVDLKVPDGKLKAPKFKKPTFTLPKMKSNSPNLKLKTPKAKGGLDLSAPKIEGDLKGPNVDLKGPKLDLEAPDLDVNGPGGKFKMPTITMPEFGRSGPKIKGPDLDLDANMKTPDLNISAPKLKGGISTPDIDVNMPKAELKGPKLDIKAPDVDVDGPGGKFKMPTLEMPDFGLSGPKVKGPDLDANIKTPKLNISAPQIEGGLSAPDVNVNMPKAEFKGPKLDIKAPDVDVDGPGGQFKMPTLKMPDFGLSGPKVKGPDLDLDANVNMPDVNMSAPKVAGDLKALKVDLPEGSLKGPKINMPSLNLSGPQLSSPDANLNLETPKLKGDINLSGPKLQSDVKGPSVDVKGLNVDINKPDVKIGTPGGKMKSPKFKFPSFGFSGSKVKSPDVSVAANVETPNIDVSVPKVKGGISTPELDLKSPTAKAGLNIPDADLDVPNPKLKGSKYKLPTFSFPKVHTGDADLNVKGDIDAPTLKAAIKGPNVDVNVPNIGDIKGPKVDVDLPKADMKGKKLNTPELSLSGPDLNTPNLKGDLSAPKLQGDLKGPNIDMKGPDFGVESPEGKFKFPKIKFPTFGRNKELDMDAKLKSPDVNLKTPQVGDLKAPHVNVNLPDADIKGPKLNMSSLDSPDVDLNLKTPTMKGHINDPNVDLKGASFDVNAPRVDVKAPNIGIDRYRGKWKLPELDGPKVKTPEINLDSNLTAPDVSMPPLKGEIQTPGFDVKGPSLDASKPRFSGPQVDLDTPKLKGDINVSTPTMKGNLQGPNINVKSPSFGMNDPDVSYGAPHGQVSFPKINAPSFDGYTPEFVGPNIKPDVSAPNTDINAKLQKLKEHSLSRIATDTVGDVDFNIPEASITGPNIKTPSLNYSGPTVSAPKADLSLQSPKMKSDAGISGPSIKGQVPDLEVDISGPKVNATADGQITRGTFKVNKAVPKVEIDSQAIDKNSLPRFSSSIDIEDYTSNSFSFSDFLNFGRKKGSVDITT
ncbi:neuroblast differentiation-associated protein AHNAK-like [Acipenser ruthenus]|uniref:neuroblast differentiation-associated protein AHNAK-like n=1 Tax=Acipenser ruthenus TaxID=7906 RepID=UPI0027411820|nr:neuroblast differentiation-associated protein AHNAK-like [Acipenser ruthenus]